MTLHCQRNNYWLRNLGKGFMIFLCKWFYSDIYHICLNNLKQYVVVTFVPIQFFNSWSNFNYSEIKIYRCSLPTKEVQALYSQQTQAESEESTGLVIIPLSKTLDYENFKASELFNELTHPAQCAIYCLQTFFLK